MKQLRPFTPADLSALHQFAIDIDRDIPLEPHLLTQTCWLAINATQQIIGFSMTEMIAPAETLQVWLHGAVHPAAQGQGVGSALLNQSLADVRTYLKNAAVSTAWLKAWADEADIHHGRLLMQFGLQPYHVYHELTFLLENLTERPSLSADITIRAWHKSHLAEVVALRNRAFRRNWGYQPTTEQALRRRFDSGRYQPRYSFTAWQDERIVGFVHGSWQRKTPQADIVWLGVAETARRQGIGRALMLTCMYMLHHDGAKAILISADNETANPQIGLYLTLGYTVIKTIVDYQAQITVSR